MVGTEKAIVAWEKRILTKSVWVAFVDPAIPKELFTSTMVIKPLNSF